MRKHPRELGNWRNSSPYSKHLILSNYPEAIGRKHTAYLTSFGACSSTCNLRDRQMWRHHGSQLIKKLCDVSKWMFDVPEAYRPEVMGFCVPLVWTVRTSVIYLWCYTVELAGGKLCAKWGPLFLRHPIIKIPRIEQLAELQRLTVLKMNNDSSHKTGSHELLVLSLNRRTIKIHQIHLLLHFNCMIMMNIHGFIYVQIRCQGSSVTHIATYLPEMI